MRAAAPLAVAMALAGCAGQLDHLGRAPSMTAPGLDRLLVEPPTPERVALMPPPPPPADVATTGSLWQSGPRSLFGDRRARQRGDIVTVVIEIDDEAEIRNTTTRARSGSDEISVSAFLGLESVAAAALPAAGSLAPAVSATGEQTTSGDGRVRRNEKITLRLAATVERVLPNGHLVVRGSQEVRINNELRDLQMGGIVRPEDISRQNLITYDKIADARIVYGGRGQISDLQQPRLGNQIVDLVSPF